MTDTVAPAAQSVSATITYALHTGEKPVNQTFETGQVIRRRTGATGGDDRHREDPQVSNQTVP